MKQMVFIAVAKASEGFGPVAKALTTGSGDYTH